MNCSVSGFLLDEKKGTFNSDDGRLVDFHTARFYDSEEGKIFKASIPSDSDSLPSPQDSVVLYFKVNAGERYCKLSYLSFE